MVLAMALQRPLTREEFVIQSLLSSREPWVTLVDAEEADPTEPMERPEPAPPRATSPSLVFDLTFVPG
jgi:hypothetical protein